MTQYMKHTQKCQATDDKQWVNDIPLVLLTETHQILGEEHQCWWHNACNVLRNIPILRQGLSRNVTMYILITETCQSSRWVAFMLMIYSMYPYQKHANLQAVIMWVRTHDSWVSERGSMIHTVHINASWSSLVCSTCAPSPRFPRGTGSWLR